MNAEVLIVAGEASADLHGAHLVRELKSIIPGAHFFGVGGRELAAEGVEITVPAESLNVVGIADWMDRVSTVLHSYRKLKDEVVRRRPRLAILLDLPDFNLRLSKALKRLGIETIYYISPQVWAWRRYRIRTIRKNVSKMLVVFPFEKTFYQKRGVDAHFVGHPLLDQIQPRRVFRDADQVQKAPRIAILPGSRPSELRHHSELLCGVITKLQARYPQGVLRIPVASTLRREDVKALFRQTVEIVEGDSRETLKWADIAVVASGTATLETAIVGTPFCLFYKMSPSTFWLVKHIIRYRRYFGMPNLLHGREVAKEFLQEGATAEAIFLECQKMIEDPVYRKRLAADLSQCQDLLGKPGASRRAAEEISRFFFGASHVSAPF